jgi:Ca-activated chloride channel family protein
MLKKEDFNNDKVDAGEIGAGHTVTAFYELIPVGQLIPGEAPEVDSLRYQARPTDDRSIRNELLTLKLRHKQPDGESSVKREFQLMNRDVKDHSPSLEFTFASSVAAFGLWLREPEFREQLSIEQILQSAESGLGKDRNGYRFNFLELIRNAAALSQE